MRQNELFRRLQMSSPELAHIIAQNPDAMRELDDMEAERVAVEIGTVIEKFVAGLTIENRNAAQ